MQVLRTRPPIQFAGDGQAGQRASANLSPTTSSHCQRHQGNIHRPVERAKTTDQTTVAETFRSNTRRRGSFGMARITGRIAALEHPEPIFLGCADNQCYVKQQASAVRGLIPSHGLPWSKPDRGCRANRVDGSFLFLIRQTKERPVLRISIEPERLVNDRERRVPSILRDQTRDPDFAGGDIQNRNFGER